jgi:AraC-like DNA-binding protein
MIYQTLIPSPPLSLAAESIWIYSGYRPPHILERVLPSGTAEMIVQLRDESFRCYDPKTFALSQTLQGPLIVGPRTDAQVIDTMQQLDVMGVHFRPGGTGMLFPMPADELSGLDLPVDSIWDGFGSKLRESLDRATTAQGKLKVMECLLRERWRDGSRLHRAIPVALEQIEEANEGFKIGDLADELGLSFRRFIEVFTSHIGLSPKAYFRVRRFQKALRAIHRGMSSSWADLASQCGWYDQAHMIRDFRALAGLTPGEYLKLNGDFMLHVPVGERGQICPIPHSQPLAK